MNWGAGIIKGLFKSIVESEMYNDTYSTIKSFIENHVDSLEFGFNIDADYESSSMELGDVSYKHMVIFNHPDHEEIIAFKVAVEAEIGLFSSTRHADNEEVIFKWFLMDCEAVLRDNDIKFDIVEVSEYSKDLKGVSSDYDLNLVPIMGKDNYEKMAKDFLLKYYPEAYEEPCSLDLSLLAKKMGVKIKYQNISKEGSIFGQIIFEDTLSSFYDENKNENIEIFVKEGTIVVDPNVFFLRNLGSISNTIIHEMVHWHFHKKAFQLERLKDGSLTKISSLVRGGVKGYDRNTPTDWMEIQANKLAPKILMPLVSFKKKTHELIKYYQEKLNVLNVIDILEYVISDLANFYVVSKISVKIRLLETGYYEALGVLNFIDDHYVRPHSFKEGALEHDQTFSISAKDALFLSYVNVDLREALNENRYKFVENHFVLNDPVYITFDLFNTPILTEYARMNMHECCLIFDIKIKNSGVSNRYYYECILCRDANSNIEFEVSFNAGLISNQASMQQFENFNSDVTALLDDLPGSFSKSLSKVIEWSEMTVEDISFGAQIEPRTLRRLKNGETKSPKRETVIALCVSMKLPSQVSYQLLEKAGFQLNKVDEHTTVLRMIINGYSFHSLDKCNELLTSNGFPALI